MLRPHATDPAPGPPVPASQRGHGLVLRAGRRPARTARRRARGRPARPPRHRRAGGRPGWTPGLFGALAARGLRPAPRPHAVPARRPAAGGGAPAVGEAARGRPGAARVRRSTWCSRGSPLARSAADVVGRRHGPRPHRVRDGGQGAGRHLRGPARGRRPRALGPARGRPDATGRRRRRPRFRPLPPAPGEAHAGIRGPPGPAPRDGALLACPADEDLRLHVLRLLDAAHETTLARVATEIAQMAVAKQRRVREQGRGPGPPQLGTAVPALRARCRRQVLPSAASALRLLGSIAQEHGWADLWTFTWQTAHATEPGRRGLRAEWRAAGSVSRSHPRPHRPNLRRYLLRPEPPTDEVLARFWSLVQRDIECTQRRCANPTRSSRTRATTARYNLRHGRTRGRGWTRCTTAFAPATGGTACAGIDRFVAWNLVGPADRRAGRGRRPRPAPRCACCGSSTCSRTTTACCGPP